MLTACAEREMVATQAPPAHKEGGVRLLTNSYDAPAVLTFLGARPAHTAFMAGLIHTNGLESPLNRGAFYGFTNREGSLEGVAHIGHAVTFETKSEAALIELARRAVRLAPPALLRGERGKIEPFWRHYERAGFGARSVCREHLLELRAATPEGVEKSIDLRRAAPAELEEVMATNVAMMLTESGVNPAQADPTGFRARTLRRIELGRVWVWTQKGRMIFKAEVMAHTPQVIYLEGVNVHPAERGKGYGLRALKQLSNSLLQQASSLCLFVNEENHAAQNLYRKAAFLPVGSYNTIYVERKIARAEVAQP